MKVDELIALGGMAPPAPPPTSPTKETMDDITRIYYDVYVPGLGAFLETTWYNFKPQGSNPVSVFLNNRPLINLFASFISTISNMKTLDTPQMATAGILETRVVWNLTCLAYTTPAAINSASDDTLPPDNAIEARNRVAVFETLLSGGALVSNPCVPPPKNGDGHRIREFEFWWWLAEYLRLQDTPQTNYTAQREQSLAKMRNLLDGRENRDMLYSMAVLRELSPKHPPDYAKDLPQHFDEADGRSKLAVAGRLLKTEAQPTSGTTNVARRFAEIAVKAFVSPGVNIGRRTGPSSSSTPAATASTPTTTTSTT